MDLKATAPPFQPGKPSTRPTSSFLPPHVLSQIQNQISGGSPRQNGMMNVHSRPFVPGMAPPPQPQQHHHQPPPPSAMPMPIHHVSHPSIQHQHHQHQQHHHHPQHPAQASPFQPASTSPVLSRPIPPRLGHGMNPGSVQLTGLQTFLGGPGGIPLSVSPNSQPHMLNGAVSPLTPGLPPSSPFMFSQNQVGGGPPRGGKHRKGRGPAPITPLKTTGHNSTPSVSLNPAAFAASLLAAKAKKKVVVAIPKEGPIPGDEAILAQQPEAGDAAGESEADADPDEPEERRVERVKLRTAKEAAAIRSKWILRQPLEDVDLTWTDEMPGECMVSCAVHPEPWPASLGLPDTIDIYLPGLSAWDEYHEIRMEEKLAEAEAEARVRALALAQAPPSHADEGNADGNDDHEYRGPPFNRGWMGTGEPPTPDLSLQLSGIGNRSKSMSIPSPSDANMANFRLNRFLASQEAPQGDPNLPSAEPAKQPAGRFQDALPLALREAFAKRQAEGTEAKTRSASGHGYTMSLGMPSSGGPFGPAALSALDMVRASSDAGPTEPAMGDRPVPEKEISEPDLVQRRSSEPSLAGIDEEAEEESEEDDHGLQRRDAGRRAQRNSTVGKAADWKELARGFGYDPDADDQGETEATPRMPSAFEELETRRHSRQASRISVSTSRQGAGGDGQDGDDELDDLDEVRTNPSEDADTSDFEEEIDSDAAAAGVDGQAHWSRRANSRKRDLAADSKRHGGGYYDDLSDMSDDNLRDSLTPSDEQYSNPSDEEAAREERQMRRQQRAALRAARHETRRQRARSGTNNTLPSSSIGEAEGLEHAFGKQASWPHHVPNKAATAAGGRAEQDIISNPSDEVQSDFDERGTFGGPLDHSHTSGDRLSQDFRFPPQPQPSQHQAHHHHQQNQHQPDSAGSPFQFKPPRTDTLGRSAGSSFLNPGAKEFRFGHADRADDYDGRRAGGTTVAGPDGLANSQEQPHPHFRLPSINNSSFGSSTFGDVVSRAQPKAGQQMPPSSSATSAGRSGGLNAAAPSFTPGAFTFTAPGAQRLEMPADTPSHNVSITVDGAEGDGRGAQGREKRQKFGPLDGMVDDDGFLRPASPPRLKGSTATIEGPLRDFGTLSRRGPPPFDAGGFVGQRTASGSRFKPDAPVFTPSWGRSTSLTGSSARRPGLPDFGFGAVGESTEQAVPATSSIASGLPAGNKAIPIRKPDESHEQHQQRRPSGLSATRGEADVPSNEADLARKIEREEGGALAATYPTAADAGSTDLERTPIASNWDRVRGAERADAADFGRSPPVAIPRPSSYEHRGMALPAPIDQHPMSRKQRMAHKHTLSRDSAAMSEDSRPRRSHLHPSHHHHHHHQQHAQSNAFDTDDESLTDFIEELAERMDKALEGWAGKILDEVTIMGQVRPVHRPGSDALDKEQMVDTFSRRVEALMDFYVDKVEKAAAAAATATSAARPSLDNGAAPGDDSQTTIRAIEAPHRQQLGNLDTLDAAGELDFDYVQDILDVKIQDLKEELKRTFAESLAARDRTEHAAKEAGTAEGADAAPAPAPAQALDLSTETSEQLASLLSARLSLALGDHARHTATDFKEQLSAILEPALDEQATRSQNKAAADRLETAHLVADQMKERIDSLDRALVDVRSSFGEHVQMALINNLLPHLETLRTEPVNGDLIAARVTEILAPMISDERERRRAERRASDELVRSPSFSAEAVAEETLSKLIPIVSSLKSDPVDSDALVGRLSEVIGKQSIEHLVDLSPVIALLEPIIAKQEDIRSFTKKMIDRQDEVERTMSELPGAINAKTEIFLSAAGETQGTSSSILSRVEKLHELLSEMGSSKLRDGPSDREAELAESLQSAREESQRLTTELHAVRAELSSAKDDHAAHRVEFFKLESKLAEAEKSRDDAVAQADSAKARETSSLDRVLEAEKQLLQSESGAREARLATETAAKEAAMFKAHMEQLAVELNEAREERAREREAAAQATAEALARAERAERQAVEAAKRADDRVDASLAAERRAQAEIKEAVERAAKAEGQAASLEKRVADQDAKIANLQALSAAQKQKMATNQQKLSEAEKKTRDFDIQAKDLAVAAARLEELEDRVKDDEELRDRLRDAQDGEARLRDEVAQYHARFSELEKDLITMKESLVGRDELEACQAELAQNREEVARLKGQLAERERFQADGGWVDVSSEGSRPHKTAAATAATVPNGSGGAWSSIHAPGAMTPRLGSDARNRYGLGQDTAVSASATPADSSAEFSSRQSGDYAAARRPAANRSMSIASSIMREVEQDDGGWWS